MDTSITECYVKVGLFEAFESAGSDTKLTPVSCTVFTLQDTCTELYITDKGTCILGQINLGMVRDIAQIPYVFMYAFNQLDKGRASALESIRSLGVYVDPEEDKQVGLGVIGLANLLVNYNVKYSEFIQELRKAVETKGDMLLHSTASLIAQAIYDGYDAAGTIAKSKGYDRAFAIAPTASYRNVDINGFTATPEISPPVCNYETKLVRRTNVQGFLVRQYPPNVEIADKDVSWQEYDQLVTLWHRMQDQDGLGHAISHN